MLISFARKGRLLFWKQNPDHKEKLPPPGLSPQDSSITDCQTRFDQKCPPATFNTDNKKILINEFQQDDHLNKEKILVPPMWLLTPGSAHT